MSRVRAVRETGEFDGVSDQNTGFGRGVVEEGRDSWVGVDPVGDDTEVGWFG